MEQRSVKTVKGTDVKNPNLVRFLFNDPRMAWLWTIVRVLVGLQWLNIALPKITNPGWMEGGAIVQGFWEAQLARPAIIYPWYADILQALVDAGAYEWLAPIIAITEVILGVMFITGAFVGPVALFACFLHWNYLMAGSAGNNGLMFPASVLLVASWKIAGYYGLDYFIMRRVSLLWSPKPQQQMEPALQS